MRTGTKDAQKSRTVRDPLVDSFGRLHDRLRVSVTDRCNLRCFYCMPATGATFRPKAELLSFEEIVRVVRVLVGRGIRKVRLTGGEPLVRANLSTLVAMLAEIDGLDDLGLTTNGLLLARDAEDLAAAGLKHLNVSLDALDPALFEQMTRRPGLERVLEGLEAAESVGFETIKLNAVSIRGLTESQLVPFGELSRRTGLEVRFIEYMPLDAESRWERDKVLFGREILDTLEAAFGPLDPVERDGPAPATTYRFRDARGTIGIIPSVSEPFCDHCNRFRMTAEGQLRSCLFSLEETDVRTLLRSGGSDADLERAAERCLKEKWSGHRINEQTFVQPDRPMYAIGG